MSNNTTSELISRAEAAERLGVTVACLEAWAHRGVPALPYCRIGRVARYRIEDIEKFIASRTGTSAAAIAAAAV